MDYRKWCHGDLCLRAVREYLFGERSNPARLGAPAHAAAAPAAAATRQASARQPVPACRNAGKWSGVVTGMCMSVGSGWRSWRGRAWRSLSCRCGYSALACRQLCETGGQSLRGSRVQSQGQRSHRQSRKVKEAGRCAGPKSPYDRYDTVCGSGYRSHAARRLADHVLVHRSMQRPRPWWAATAPACGQRSTRQRRLKRRWQKKRSWR